MSTWFPGWELSHLSMSWSILFSYTLPPYTHTQTLAKRAPALLAMPYLLCSYALGRNPQDQHAATLSLSASVFSTFVFGTNFIRQKLPMTWGIRQLLLFNGAVLMLGKELSNRYQKRLQATITEKDSSQSNTE